VRGDGRNDQQLVVSKGIVRRRGGKADGLANDHQQLKRDLGLIGHAPERGRREACKSIEDGEVQEGERDRAVPSRRGHFHEREPRLLEARQQADPTNVPRARWIGAPCQEPQLAEPLDIRWVRACLGSQRSDVRGIRHGMTLPRDPFRLAPAPWDAAAVRITPGDRPGQGRRHGPDIAWFKDPAGNIL
jgi:hypothetical protein